MFAWHYIMKRLVIKVVVAFSFSSIYYYVILSMNSTAQQNVYFTIGL